MIQDPGWNEIQQRIESFPKPPISAVVVQTAQGETRSFEVLHDGLDGWYIDDGIRVEASFGPSSTVIQDPGGLIAIRDVRVASNGWLKSLLHGRLMASLDRISVRVVGHDRLQGRSCWILDAEGLREEPTPFRLWVDEEFGFVLRIEGASALVEFQDLIVGTVQGPEQP